MKLTILCNDKAREPFKAEHGLSILIDRQIIFDTGMSSVAVENAQKLDIDLSNVKKIFISHGHYDHIGGLPYILEKTKRVDVYVHKKALLPKYSGSRFTGIPYDWEDVQSKSNVQLLEGDVEIDGVKVLNNVLTYENIIDGKFTVDGHRDLFEDEINIIKDGVLLTGCAHRGIENIFSASQSIRAIVGGFHLLNASIDRINKIAQLFKNADVTVVPLHCTGDVATEILKMTLKDKCILSFAGDTVEL
ncbi:MAG: MBL fold metallo-hydrolase [Fervidobacterium sp.]|jgi:7,8-dihydropterin-6-yl-methyl-4-(beta-D-ribofuranosyl)aminobenzene 5'-phosphate synthase